MWADVPSDDVAARVITAAERTVRALVSAGDLATLRPQPAVWSAIEYAAHVRDVLIAQRDRMVLALVEDAPSFAPIYRDHRVDLGLYADDSVAGLAEELPVAARLFARAFGRLDQAQLARPLIYNFPAPTERTILWLGQQTVHESEHHGTDVDAVIAAVAT